jgi:hypothetical protein
MQAGQTVRIRYMARAYLGVITRANTRNVRVRFTSTSPAINGSRRTVRSFPVAVFNEYGKSGVDYVAKISAGV